MPLPRPLPAQTACGEGGSSVVVRQVVSRPADAPHPQPFPRKPPRGKGANLVRFGWMGARADFARVSTRSGALRGCPHPRPLSRKRERGEFDRASAEAGAGACHPEPQAHRTGPYSTLRGAKDLAADTLKPERGSGHPDPRRDRNHAERRSLAHAAAPPIPNPSPAKPRGGRAPARCVLGPPAQPPATHFCVPGAHPRCAACQRGGWMQSAKADFGPSLPRL
jgi:hypothetical protein